MLMQSLYRIRRALLRRLRLRTRGVKVMLFNPAGEILLIRNSYGPSHLFVLPGGGIGRGETPEAAAAREVKEEVGLDVHGLARVSEHFSAAEGKRDTIHLFAGRADGAPRTDSLEIEEARFFPLDALPPNASAATLRRIAEYKGERRSDGSW
ncbi:MAG: NUDIX domain-containing protein [Allosphingosinicella sp.]